MLPQGERDSASCHRQTGREASRARREKAARKTLVHAAFHAGRPLQVPAASPPERSTCPLGAPSDTHESRPSSAGEQGRPGCRGSRSSGLSSRRRRPGSCGRWLLAGRHAPACGGTSAWAFAAWRAIRGACGCSRVRSSTYRGGSPSKGPGGPQRGSSKRPGSELGKGGRGRPVAASFGPDQSGRHFQWGDRNACVGLQ